MMSEYSEIQKPQLPYVHEFETDQLDSMSDCLAEHGFAVIKNVLKGSDFSCFLWAKIITLKVLHPYSTFIKQKKAINL